MIQFLFTLDDNPTIHAAPLPGPFLLYCEADAKLHRWYQSAGPSVTCPECRERMAVLWLAQIKEAQTCPTAQVILFDSRGMAVLSKFTLKQDDQFIEFTVLRDDTTSECFYKTARLINMLIDSRARYKTSP